MYVNFENRQRISLDDTFFHLVNVNAAGDMDIEVRYNISPGEVLKDGATSVKVSILTKNVLPKASPLGPIINAKSNQNLINDILTLTADAKASAKQQNVYVAATRVSDFTANISNSIVSKLALTNDAPAPSILSLETIRVNAIQSLNDAKPMLQQNIVSMVTSSINVQNDILNMIMRDGVDPSSVVDLTARSITAYDSMHGFNPLKTSDEVLTDPVSKYQGFLLGQNQQVQTTKNVQPGAYVQVLTVSSPSQISIPIKLTIPVNALMVDGKPVTTLFVKFELLQANTNVLIDSIMKDVPLAQHVQLFFTPRLPPTVSATASEIFSRVNVEIKQNDPIATSVKMYQKHMYRSSFDTDDYVFFGEYRLRFTDQSLLIPVDKPLNSIALYRVVPVSDRGIIGFNYTNIVVRPVKFFPFNHVSLVTSITDVGFKLEIRDVPSGVVSVRIVRADKTLFESSLVGIGEPILIAPGAATPSFLTVIDRNVKDDHVYEHACEMTWPSGKTEIAGNTINDYHKLNDSRVDTKIRNLNVSHVTDEPNVTFDINTEILDSDLDAVKNMLERQNMIDYFSEDVLQERDKLKQLLAHSVSRVDLVTGQREDFGVITSGSFSDVDLRKNSSVSSLAYGHKYRYDVNVLLRASETMFFDFVKTSIDPVSKREYTFSPAKFLHPITLKKGDIISADSLKILHPQSAMVHGQIGSVTSVDVSFDEPPAKIESASVFRFDFLSNYLTWQLTGDINRIDHFVILRLTNGLRTIIGKAHSEFLNGNCSFVHDLGPRDKGALTYQIMPVFNNYLVGDAMSTNEILI